jgi:hypothetical protein
MRRRTSWWIGSFILLGCGGTAGMTAGGGGGNSGAIGGSAGMATNDASVDVANNGVGGQGGTANPVTQCRSAGGACSTGIDCCSLHCESNVCDATACTSDDGACTSSDACCSGNCSSGTCQPLNATCKTAGNACAANGECCSKLCKDGACVLSSSFCIQSSDVCSTPADCCSGTCNVAAGAKLGTCGAPPTGSSYCSGGIDGTVCSGCNDCCSRLCAPYGPSGVNICQPASGCHVNGDLCRKDSDCCGAAGTGLPGDGNVTCEIAAGKAIGICRNPTGCNPQGNVCHFQNYACSISSARNDCCGAPGNSGACQLDPLGVPRCAGLGDVCRQAGATCSSEADCCNRTPCVADASGMLHCKEPSDAGSACSVQGGPCTINGDCCVGNLCNRPLGSTSGTCGPYTPPPPSSDAGTPAGDSGSTSYDAGTTCALYGQSCKVGSDCCGGIPCIGIAGPCMGETGCICVTPVR